jgi:hypothetical protein
MYDNVPTLAEYEYFNLFKSNKYLKRKTGGYDSTHLSSSFVSKSPVRKDISVRFRAPAPNENKGLVETTNPLFSFGATLLLPWE